MSQTGKFIPGGGGFNKNPPDPGRSEPIRAPAPPEAPASGKRMFARGAAERLARPVDPKRKPGITIISVIFCVIFISIGWYYLAVRPAQIRAINAKLELDKRTLEFEKFKKEEEERRIADEKARATETAEFKVTTIPPGAVVMIGNVSHTTPADLKYLKPGKVTVKIELSGYETVTRDITLEGTKTVDMGVIEMSHRVGKINLTTVQPGATYTLTGPDNFNRSGSLNAILDGLNEGDYTLVAEYKGWILPAIKLQVKSGEVTAYEVVFPYSSISLESYPTKAIVKSGKVKVGETPLSVKQLRPGTRSYTLEFPGYKTQRVELTIAAGVDLKKLVTLEKSDDIVTSFGMLMIKLPSGYWGGKYEVRQTEYDKVMNSNPSAFRGANRPVDSVTWTQAMDFCKKATEMEKLAGRLPDGYIFSLPTEPQWDYMLADSNLDNAVTSRDAELKSDTEVGSSEPNQFGLYDMLGNVWEWCLDPFDPSGRTHVMRGGSWLSSKENFPDSSVRNGAGENYHDRFTGFRVVLVKAPPSTP